MKVKNLKQKLIECLIIAALILIFYIFDIPCLFQGIFHIHCPGCGITRAYISLLHLDIQKAFEYNPMFWSVPILALLYFTDGNIFGKKIINTLIYIFLFAGFFINWIIKFFI